MRIGIDVRSLAEGKRTGVEEYVIALLDELFSLDRQNEYVLFFNAWEQVVPNFGWCEQYPNVTLKVFHIPNKLLNLSLWYLRWPKLDRLIGGVDVYFLPNLNFVAVSRRSKLVLTAHDLSFELFPETFSWKQRVWHYFVNFRRLVRYADRIIAVSQSTRDDLVAQYGVSEEKIVVIPSGIDACFRPIDHNDPALLAVQEKYRLPYKFILFLGTFEPRKNILTLVRAYEELVRLQEPTFSKYALVLAGTGGWESEALFSAITASPCREQILLPGFIDDADKAAFYNLSSIFVYPSLYEGFGFPPLEALACGVPVIVSHSSSLPEIVGQAGMLIDPYQPEELLQALRQLITDQTLSVALREKGLWRSKLFSWERSARETLSVFRSLT